MKKIGIIWIFFLCLFGLGMTKSAQVQENLRENLIRLHIIANSDSDYDQKIKLNVRDELLRMGEYDAEKLSETANSILKDLKTGYGAEVCYRDRYVPEKTYKNIALPEGRYTCLDVVLGDGNGKNWWCIAYPPLCFTEALSGEMSEEAKKELKSRLSSESLSVILKNENMTYRFKIVEDFQKLIKFLE
ncbi:MAG: stage II sporulation protein R [Clostridia bacterium]|nr:stage II sporulation protein R [Clostridia bacterium]